MPKAAVPAVAADGVTTAIVPKAVVPKADVPAVVPQGTEKQKVMVTPPKLQAFGSSIL